MYKLISRTMLSVLVLIALTPVLAHAQQNIAIIDIEGAALNSEYAKQQRKILEQNESFKQKRTQYSELGKNLQGMEQDAKTNGLTWSQEQKKAHNSEAKSKLNELNKLGQELDAEVKKMNATIAKELNPKIDAIVKAMLKEKNIGLLLKPNTVHFASPGFDLTPELLERLNKAN